MNEKIIQTKLKALDEFIENCNDVNSLFKQHHPNIFEDYYLKMFKIFLLINYGLQTTKYEVDILLDYKETYEIRF